MTRAMGAESKVKMDCDYLDIMIGDVILICTDGFWENLCEEKMLSYLRHYTNMKNVIVDMLSDIEHTNANKDNYSVIGISIE